MNQYPSGSVVRCYAAFTDAEEAALDPTTVSVTFRAGGVSEDPLVYGTDAEVVRDLDEGGNPRYYVDYDTTGVAGYVDHVWRSTGTGQAVGKGRFEVREV